MLADLPDTMIERMRGIAEIRTDGVTQGQLEEAWEVSRQRVSQVIGALERRGYVREVGTEDRSRLYALTGTGQIALGLAETA
jgi:chromosome segregation and condensation protein ScpB